MKKLGSIAWLILPTLLTVTACDLVHPPPVKEDPKPLPQQVLVDTPLTEPSKGIALTDLSLSKLNDGRINTDGDMRPFWTVSGRITNNTSMPIKNAHIQVRVWNTAAGEEDLDSAVMNFKDEIPRYSTVSFRQAIQLSVPDKGWKWNCFVLDAMTQTYQFK